MMGDLKNDTNNEYSLFPDSQLVNSFGSYGSVNSDHFEGLKPGVTPGINNSIKINTIGGKIKRFLLGRTDSLTEPRFEDEHVITFQDNNLFQLFIFAVKHALWVFITTIPAILVVCSVTIGYSHIHWTEDCSLNETYTTSKCIYYKKENLIYFDVVARLILLSIIPVIVACISIIGTSNLPKYLLYVSLPMVTIVIVSIPGLLKFNELLFYYIDILMFIIVFVVTLIAAIFFISKDTENISFKSMVKICVLPSIFAALGIGFIDAIVNKKYQTLQNDSIGQYLIRIIFYPIIVDLLISVGEANIRKVPTNSMNDRSHVIYFYQVAFTIIGRYMTTISGCLVSIIIMTASIAFKDIFFHRMSRFQCWLAFKSRTVLRKFCPKHADQEFDTFKDWFFSKEFTSFKANVLNSDFTIELTGVIVVPVVMVTFKSHHLLFNFKDDSFQFPDGNLNYKYLIEQECVQLLFVFVSIVLITMFEARYNHVNLMVAYKRMSVVQYMSQIFIYIWGVLLLLSSVRVTPNYIQCNSINDICDCNIAVVSLKNYGC